MLGWLSEDHFLRTPSPAKESCLELGSKREKVARGLLSYLPEISFLQISRVRVCVRMCMCMWRPRLPHVSPQDSFRIITTSADSLSMAWSSAVRLPWLIPEVEVEDQTQGLLKHLPNEPPHPTPPLPAWMQSEYPRLALCKNRCPHTRGKAALLIHLQMRKPRLRESS